MATLSVHLMPLKSDLSEKCITTSEYLFRLRLGPFSVALSGERSSYPTCLCQLAVSSVKLPRLERDRLRSDFFTQFSSKAGEPFLLEAIAWLLERAQEQDCSSDAVAPCSEQQDSLLLLQYDHMRDRKGYVRLLTRWSQELGLKGRLFFLRHPQLILLLLHGCRDDCKVRRCCMTRRNNFDNLRVFVSVTFPSVGNSNFQFYPQQRFLQLQKTSVVDVDSKGRGCKERMMSVLHQGVVADLLP